MRRILDACLFAARAHGGQTRKGAAAEPYVNHVIEVAARVAASPGACADTVVAALLHDVVEDAAVPEAVLRARFGDAVAAIVMEVTDPPDLDSTARKALQAATVAGKSPAARRIKLADKAANLAAIADSPPLHWDAARKALYLDWAERVAAGCRGVDGLLEAAFDAEMARARAALG